MLPSVTPPSLNPLESLLEGPVTITGADPDYPAYPGAAEEATVTMPQSSRSL